MNVKGRGQVPDGDGTWSCQDDERSILRQRHVIHAGERTRRDTDQRTRRNEQGLSGSVEVVPVPIHRGINVAGLPELSENSDSVAR